MYTKKKETTVRKKRTTVRRKKVCRFCVDTANQMLDYREFMTLKPFLTERGKIIPARITGNCAKHQRRVKNAVKMSRTIAVSPFTAVTALSN